MLDSTILFTVIIGVLIAGMVGYLFYLQRKNQREEQQKRLTHSQLPLQAYERLILLVDRIALPHLINRIGSPDITAHEMQILLARQIREEFDYNITQQIYVSPEIWKALVNLKEQNLLLIHQFAAALPTHAMAVDLNRILLNHFAQYPKASLHELVSEAISFEVKKLL